jgi:hypothetical protein
MAIFKKSSSGKQIQFVDDSGVIYPTSKVWLLDFIHNPSKTILEVPRYAVPLPEGKFRKSQVYDPTGAYARLAEKSEDGKVDTMKKSVTEDIKQEEKYNKIVKF